VQTEYFGAYSPECVEEEFSEVRLQAYELGGWLLTASAGWGKVRDYKAVRAAQGAAWHEVIRG
jgi:hypothetical protein